MGIRPDRIFATATGIAMVVVTIAALYLGDPRQFRSDHRPGAADLCLRGRDHRRAGLALGHAAGGIIIGVAQTVGAAINPEWQILAGHLAFLVVLLVRPRGLFPAGLD